jgi:hypothetical protein
MATWCHEAGRPREAHRAVHPAGARSAAPDRRRDHVPRRRSRTQRVQRISSSGIGIDEGSTPDFEDDDRESGVELHATVCTTLCEMRLANRDPQGFVFTGPAGRADPIRSVQRAAVRRAARAGPSTPAGRDQAHLLLALRVVGRRREARLAGETDGRPWKRSRRPMRVPRRRRS